MFIWFIFRDDPTSTWQSGLLNRNSTKKPAFSPFAVRAKPLDARNPVIRVKLNVAPVVRLSIQELAARNGAGALVGANIKVYGPNQSVPDGHADAVDHRPGRLGDVHLRAERHEADLLPLLDIQDKNGNVIQRQATLIIA